MIPYTPGVTKKRVVLYFLFRFVMAQTNHLIKLWGDVIVAGTYIRNQVSSKLVPKNLYELGLTKTILVGLCPLGVLRILSISIESLDL